MRITARATRVVLILTLTCACTFGHALAQRAPRTVADGVYTDVQATRGAAAYDANCVRCHRADLGGLDGPALTDDRFNRTFAGRPLQGLFERMRSTMPRGAPGSLAEGVYVDILAHLLRENGFAAGAHELTTAAMEHVEVLPTRQTPLPPVGDFSYVEVTGCLARGGDGAWMLERATDPVAVRPIVPGVAPLPPTIGARHGGQTIRLVDAMAYDPEPLRGHLLRVTGRLIVATGQPRLSISSLETLAPAC